MWNAIKSNIIVEARGILDTKFFERLVDFNRGSLKNMFEVTYAASLAHHGLLGSFKLPELKLCDDLTPVQAKHLASLVPAVIGRVDIENVRGCDLVPILDNVKSKGLFIKRQSLGSEETQALVRAIESRVEIVCLEDVTIDISDLTSYNLMDRFRGKLMTLARSRNWNLWMWKKENICLIQRPDNPFHITMIQGPS